MVFLEKIFLILDSVKIFFPNVKKLKKFDFGVSENKVRMRSILKRGWKSESEI